MIPQILHQTWKDTAVPIAFSKYMESWKRFHPGWDFRFWTDADLAELVESRCPECSNLFHSYPMPIMRTDLGRYLILREFGGVYADIDAEAMASISPLLESEVPIFAYEPRSHAALEFIRSRGFRSIVSNAVILSPAGHPFWDHLLRLMHRCRFAHNPLDASGPFVLTAAVEQAPPAATPHVLPAHVFCPIDKFGVPVNRDQSTLVSFAFHHWAGTWQRSQVANASVTPPTPQVIMQEIAASAAEANRFLQSIDRAAVDTERSKKGRVLVAVPARDAAESIDSLFERILALRYPRDDLSLAFLEGDSGDDTLNRVNAFARLHGSGFRRIQVIKRDFGVKTPTPRWAPAMQRSRRSHIARVRNELIRQALQDEDWVLWVDSDIVGFTDDILTTLLSTGARIVHPNTVRIPGGASMDLNAWTMERQVSWQVAAYWIKDGLYQPPVGFQRLYLSDMRYRDVVALHSVGGTMLLVDADLHRAGLLFPENPYRFLIETEGFAMAACDIGIFPVGLPNVEVIHSAR
jgi:Anp1/Glycosyltransferase sugar-binding region containing DXD motif